MGRRSLNGLRMVLLLAAAFIVITGLNVALDGVPLLWIWTAVPPEMAAASPSHASRLTAQPYSVS